MGWGTCWGTGRVCRLRCRGTGQGHRTAVQVGVQAVGAIRGAARADPSSPVRLLALAQAGGGDGCGRTTGAKALFCFTAEIMLTGEKEKPPLGVAAAPAGRVMEEAPSGGLAGTTAGRDPRGAGDGSAARGHRGDPLCGGQGWGRGCLSSGCCPHSPSPPALGTTRADARLWGHLGVGAWLWGHTGADAQFLGISQGWCMALGTPQAGAWFWGHTGADA